jgi:hypothetical protein
VKEAMVTRPLSGIIVSLVSIFAGALTTDLDHGQHSAFFKFANNYWCRAGDPTLADLARPYRYRQPLELGSRQGGRQKAMTSSLRGHCVLVMFMVAPSRINS